MTCTARFTAPIEDTVHILPEGTIKRVHINRYIIDKNRKEGTDTPAITVKCKGKNYYGREVQIDGPSLLTSKQKPLDCGARIYIVTRERVRVVL